MGTEIGHWKLFKYLNGSDMGPKIISGTMLFFHFKTSKGNFFIESTVESYTNEHWFESIDRIVCSQWKRFDWIDVIWEILMKVTFSNVYSFAKHFSNELALMTKLTLYFSNVVFTVESEFVIGLARFALDLTEHLLGHITWGEKVEWYQNGTVNEHIEHKFIAPYDIAMYLRS
jgi:hypothetical protein